MRYRTLGGTGIEVSTHCLGTMMFGRSATPITTTAPGSSTPPSTPGSTSSTPPTCTPTVSPRRSSARRSRAAARTSSWRPRCISRWARARTAAATRGAGSSTRSRRACGGSDRLDRPVPGTPAGPLHRHRGDPVGADRPGRQGKIRAFGCSTFPAEEIVEAYHVAERRGSATFRTEQPPYSFLARGIETSVLPTCAAARHGRADLEPARVRLPVRPGSGAASRST